jgi:hypothetical protein
MISPIPNDIPEVYEVFLTSFESPSNNAELPFLCHFINPGTKE